jgi:PAS domain S-box-containing protein
MTFEKHYESIIKTASLGYVFCKIIKNDAFFPVDIEIVEVNNAFEKLFQVEARQIIGKSFSLLENNFFDENKNWILSFEKINNEFNSKYFEKFYDRLKKWYSINAFSNQSGFITLLFQDISERKLLPDILKIFTSYNYKNVDYNFISEKAKEISGARYVIFNKYNEDSQTYCSLGVSHFSESIEKIISLLGFDFRDRTWKSDSKRESLIGHKKWTKFENLSDLSGEAVPAKIINNAAKILGLGDCFLFRSYVDQIILGDLILVYGKNDRLQNLELMETYSEMVGLLLNRVNSEQLTTTDNQEFQYYKNFSDLVVNNTTDTIVVISFSLNPVYEYVSPSILRNLGYTPDYLIGKHIWDLDIIYPEDKIKIQNLLTQYYAKKNQIIDLSIQSNFSENIEYKLRNISGKWINCQSSVSLAGDKIIIVERNITESLALEQEITDLFYINLDILCTFDKKGNFKKVSEEWYNLLGYTPKDLKTLNLRNIVHPEDYDSTLYSLVKLTGNKKITHIVNRCRHQNGSYRILEWRINKTGENFVASARDITTRKQTEDEIAHFSKMQELLIKISSNYININIDQIDEIIQNSLSEIAGFVNADRAYVYEYVWDLKQVKKSYEWHLDQNPDDKNVQLNTNFENYESWIAFHKSGETISISNVNAISDSELIKRQLENRNIKSLIAIPMMEESKCVGFVEFDTVINYQNYTEKEEALLKVFTEMLVNMRNRIKSVHVINRQFEIQKLLTSISSDFVGANSYNLDDKVKVLLKETSQFFDADRSYIIHFREEHKEGIYKYEWSRDTVQTKIRKNQKVPFTSIPWIMEELKSNFLIHVPDFSELPVKAVSEKQNCVKNNIQSFLIIPIFNKNTIIGCIGFEAIYARKQWEDHEIKVLKVLANIYAESYSKVQIEKELIEAKNIAEGANKAKTEFLSNMSHEIRTPLNGVIGFTELLKNTPLNTIQQEYLSNAITSANSLLGIISDILDFSKIEAGKLDLEYIKTDLIHLVENASDIIKIQASKKRLELLLNIQPDAPRFAVIDPVRLKQILVNLLNNAVKFTPAGEVEFGLSFEKINEKIGKFTFTIRDTGIGINESESKKLFKAFSQADTSTTRRYGGTGLGLVISNSLAKQMDSFIKYRSEENIGSTFEFSIETEYEYGDVATDKKIENINRILIVDDNSNNRMILKHSFQHWGIESIEADNGIEALKLIENEPPFDVFIVDFHMPYINGIDTIKLIQKNQKFNPETQSIILLHSSSEDQIIQQGIKDLKVRFSITKPVKPNELYYYLKNLNTKKTFTKTLEPNIQENKEQNKPTNFEISILIAEDIKMNMILIKNLLKNIYPKALLKEVYNGKEALESVKLNKPDLILMDVQMPIMDGIEATKQIKSVDGGKYADIPIIALTAGVSSQERDECFQVGMCEFISKPIDRTNLFKILHKVFPQQELIQIMTTSWNENEHFNKNKFIEKLGNNGDFYKSIIETALQEFPNYIGDLEKAILANEINKINRTAHAIKGSAYNIEFTTLGNLAFKIESHSDQPEMYKNLFAELIKEWEIIKNQIKRKD